jgi:Ca2+/Na+ antiporter
MIVKSSLALSLGLVGALSIVRFRAAIKEPEELVYLFLVITAGLGCGAGQIKIIVVGILFALLIIYIYHFFYNKKNTEYTELINLAIIIDEDVNEDDINKIINEIKLISKELNFISMSKTQTTTSLNLDIRPNDFNEILKITNTIKNKFKNSKTIVARNSNLNL